MQARLFGLLGMVLFDGTFIFVNVFGDWEYDGFTTW